MLQSPAKERLKAEKGAPGFPCRFCGAALTQTFVNLGLTPLCQNRIRPSELGQPETYYPLHAFVCSNCFLVQLGDSVAPETIFEDYGYFSSFSDSWLRHVEAYTRLMIDRFELNSKSLVVELASNDGYLLQYFVEHGIPVHGVEPASTVAQAAVAKGIPTTVQFFGSKTAQALREEIGQADLLLGNNVLAHVPDLNDFVNGMKVMLKSQGVITMEFPHLVRLVDGNQFDTIYHEHFSYFSFSAVRAMFQAHGITLFDVEELPTHGGSLRIYGCHAESKSPAVASRVHELLEREEKWGVHSMQRYAGFNEDVKETKRAILEFLITARRQGKTVVGYGAPGKGNTLLNYCGIGTDFLDYTVDRSPHKQGTYTPGARIPVHAPSKLKETKPDYLFVLPWNLKDEIMEQTAFIREWGGKFAIPIPNMRVY